MLCSGLLCLIPQRERKCRCRKPESATKLFRCQSASRHLASTDWCHRAFKEGKQWYRVDSSTCLLGFVEPLLQKSRSTVLSVRPKPWRKIMLGREINSFLLGLYTQKDSRHVPNNGKDKPRAKENQFNSFSFWWKKVGIFYFSCKSKKPLFKIQHLTPNWMLSSFIFLVTPFVLGIPKRKDVWGPESPKGRTPHQWDVYPSLLTGQGGIQAHSVPCQALPLISCATLSKILHLSELPCLPLVNVALITVLTGWVWAIMEIMYVKFSPMLPISSVWKIPEKENLRIVLM